MASSTAYYLATRHGITNVAVLEADYIGSGNSGRNTTIIRANYGLPEAVRFYQHSPRPLPDLEDGDRRRIMHQTRACSGWRTPRWACATERARCLHEPGLRRRDGDGHAGEIKAHRARSST